MTMRKRVTIDLDKNQSSSSVGPKKKVSLGGRSSSVPLRGAASSASVGSFLYGSSSDAAAGSEPKPTPAPGGRSNSPTHDRSGSPLPIYSPRRDGMGPYNANGLRSTVARTYVLDWSFLDIDEPIGIREVDPRHGKEVKKKKKEPSAEELAALNAKDAKMDKKKMQGLSNQALFFGGGNQGGTMRTDDGFLVMRAKEETYAFKESTDDPLFGDKDMKNYQLDSAGNLVKRDEREIQREAALAGRGDTKYYCTTLKLNNNLLTGFNTLVSVLYQCTVKPFLNLTVLDLSCNKISSLPPLRPNGDGEDGEETESSKNLLLSELPLHTLLLHQNKITSLKDIINLQGLHKTLKKLTLNGNPIQTTLKKYKWVILHHLPFLMSFDDCRITLGDREKMDIFEQMFIKKEERGSTGRLLPELMPRSQSSLGVLGQYF